MACSDRFEIPSGTYECGKSEGHKSDWHAATTSAGDTVTWNDNEPRE